MKRYIKSSYDDGRSQYIELGPVNDLPYNKLLSGVQRLELKDMEPYEGQTVYYITKEPSRHYDEYTEEYTTEYKYCLVPLYVKSYAYTPKETGMWRIPEEHSIYAVIPGTNSTRYFSTKSVFDNYYFYTSPEAEKIQSNAAALLDERDYLNDRYTQIDVNEIKTARQIVPNQSKTLQCNDAFSNGLAKVSLGTSGDSNSFTAYIHVSPTDGPFMSSSLYEIHYLPMTDGVVYRSYGAFGSAAGKADWFRNQSNNVVEISVDEFHDDLEQLVAIYDSLIDGFSDSELGKEISTRYRSRQRR